MDDPLIGLTIWQSAQQKKGAVRVNNHDLLLTRNEGVDVKERTLLNGRGGGGRRAGGNSGAKRKEGKRVGKRETVRGGEVEEDNCFPCLPGLEGVGTTTEKTGKKQGKGESEKKEGDFVKKSEEEEEEECELTERSMLGHEAVEGDGGRRTPPREAGAALVDHAQFSSPVPQPQNFWLMRLFQSKLFDMSIAVGYLFKSKEADIQAYLGNKLFVSACIHVHELHVSANMYTNYMYMQMFLS